MMMTMMMIMSIIGDFLSCEGEGRRGLLFSLLFMDGRTHSRRDESSVRRALFGSPG